MSAHSPGPWEVQPYVVDLFGREVGSTSPGPLEVHCRIIADDAPMIICDMVAGSTKDAHLIAAAPDLLALVERAHRSLDASLRGERPPENHLALANDLRAAIAKARGDK